MAYIVASLGLTLACLIVTLAHFRESRRRIGRELERLHAANEQLKKDVLHLAKETSMVTDGSRIAMDIPPGPIEFGEHTRLPSLIELLPNPKFQAQNGPKPLR